MNEMIVDRAEEALALRAPNMGTDSLKTVQLSPDGMVKSLAGTFLMDLEGSSLLIEAFKQRGVDTVVDYEHASEGGIFSAPNGQAPAAGWVQSIHYEKGRGLFGMVKWNADAAELIRADKYRYLSPSLLVRKSDRRAVALRSVGLTNMPAIPRMEKVAASTRAQVNADAAGDAGESKPADGGTGDLKGLVAKLRELLGVEGDVAAVLQAAITALEDKEPADDETAEPVANADPPAGFVPEAEFEQLLAINREHENYRLAEQAQALVDKYTLREDKPGLFTGVIDPKDDAAIEAALAFAQRDPEGFEGVFSTLRPLPPQGRTTAPAAGVCQRVQVIASARGEYRGDASLAVTSEEAFISLRLQEKNLARLSEDESREFGLMVG